MDRTLWRCGERAPHYHAPAVHMEPLPCARLPLSYAPQDGQLMIRAIWTLGTHDRDIPNCKAHRALRGALPEFQSCAGRVGFGRVPGRPPRSAGVDAAMRRFKTVDWPLKMLVICTATNVKTV